MRTLARFGAVLIEGGVAVVAAAGGLAAGGLRRYATHGQGGDPGGRGRGPREVGRQVWANQPPPASRYATTTRPGSSTSSK